MESKRESGSTSAAHVFPLSRSLSPQISIGSSKPAAAPAPSAAPSASAAPETPTKKPADDKKKDDTKNTKTDSSKSGASASAAAAAAAPKGNYVPTKEQMAFTVHDGREHLNIVFIGHVDAGKSTIAGQVLYVCSLSLSLSRARSLSFSLSLARARSFGGGSLPPPPSPLLLFLSLLTGRVDERTIQKYEKEAKEKGRASWYLAFILDTNEEERAKGKTVEVGRAHFTTQTKRYTLLDAPGRREGGSERREGGRLLTTICLSFFSFARCLFFLLYSSSFFFSSFLCVCVCRLCVVCGVRCVCRSQELRSEYDRRRGTGRCGCARD